MNEFLDLARNGKNQWWRYLLAVFTILVFWQIIGAGPSILLMLWTMLDGNPATVINNNGTFESVSVTLSFIVFMLASWAFMVGIYIAVRVIHGRRFISLITPSNKINWKRIFHGFLVWMMLAALVAVFESILYPERYAWTFELQSFIPFFFLAIILIPIQTTAEELFFRSYVLQGFGLKIRNIWILSAISGFLFMLPHFLNPEAQLNFFLMGIYYFAIGFAMAYVSLRDGSLELALGLHAANNLFTGLFANSIVTVMPTPSMFTVMEMDVEYSVLASLVVILIFILIFAGPLRRKDPLNESSPS